VTISTAGFQFRYRLEGRAPTVRRFHLVIGEALTAGDIVQFDRGGVRVAVTGDCALLGAAVQTNDECEEARYVDVVVDGDAVYAVRDDERREAGATLDLSGPPGAQGAAPGRNAELEVVVDSAADGETLVRIRVDKHCEIVLSAPPEQPHVGRFARSELTADRENALVVATAAGDPVACEQLVEAFLPAVSGVARLYRGSGVERTELLQEGVVGLMRACRRFDADLGAPFWAYATWWVRRAMQQLVACQTRPTVLSDRALRGLARLKEARRGHLQAHGCEPSIDELVEATGLPRKQIDSLLVVERAPRGLDEPVAGEDGSATLVDLLADPVAEEEYDKVEERVEIERVRDLTDGLGKRERTILYEHYGVGRPSRTLREIGDDIGVSAERVRQIEEQTLEKLRAAALTLHIHG
jgi:RNA polymerase sigma factor (sigma-70 family)